MFGGFDRVYKPKVHAELTAMTGRVTPDFMDPREERINLVLPRHYNLRRYSLRFYFTVYEDEPV